MSGNGNGNGHVNGNGHATVPFVDLQRQHAPLVGEMRRAFHRVVHAGSFVLGREVDSFEAEFADSCEAPHCIGVSSGTAALGVAMRAAGIGPGDEVIVPAHTFIASALGVVHAGATPVLCDVDEATGLIDADAAAAAIGPRTAAIVAVHLYGQPCDMDALRAVTRARGILLVEDAAQAHGARWRDVPAGSLGDVACFSFYPSKNLGALGDGGAICTASDEIAERARRLRNLGQRAKGEHIDLGFNERLDGLQAALLRCKLPLLESWNARRREHAAQYRAALDGVVELLPERAEALDVHHLFPIRHPDRDALGARLGERGVQTGLHYSPSLPEHPALGYLGADADAFPNAKAWASDELSLPMFAELTEPEVDRVVAAVSALVAAPAV